MNREIFTMSSAQDVPIDSKDAMEIEMQESVKGVRNLIREMLLQGLPKAWDTDHRQAESLGYHRDSVNSV